MMVTSFKTFHAHTAALSAPTLQPATSDPCLCQRPLDTHRRVWVSLLQGLCSFLPDPGTHKVLFVPSKSLFSQSSVSSGSSMVGLMAISSKRACLCYCTLSPHPCGRPLLTCPSAGNTQTQFWLSLCGVSGSWCPQGSSEHLWWVWGLILNMISPLLPFCWVFPIALGCGASFFHGIQHFPINGCSAAADFRVIVKSVIQMCCESIKRITQVKQINS